MPTVGAIRYPKYAIRFSS